MTDDAFAPTKIDAKTDPKTDAETHDEAGNDEAVDGSSPLGAADTGNDNANDDEHGIIGEEA